MAYTKYSLTPGSNTAAPPDGAPEGMLPSAVNDTMRDMMAQIRDCGDGIRGGTYTMTAPVITGGSITGSTINNAVIGGTTRAAGSFTTVTTTNDASISGLTVGKGAGAVANNTALGTSALAGSNSGSGQNTAIGANALASNTTGTNNVGVGYLAGQANTTGGANIMVGVATGYNNTASYNTAIGGGNTFYTNTSGTANTAVGGGDGTNDPTMRRNTTGSYNTALGMCALASNTTASNNTAVGYQAGYSQTTAQQSTFIGNQAGYATTGSYNTFVGNQAGYALTSGTINTFLGINSGISMTTGSKNTILGSYSGNQGGLDIRTSSNYIVLSDGDGNPRLISDNSGYVAIGTTSAVGKLTVNNTDAGTRTISASSPASYAATMFRSDSVTAAGTGWYHLYGSSSSSTVNNIFIYGNGNIQNANNSYGAISDIKLKENITDATPKLDKLMQVKVRNYNLKGEYEQHKQIGVIAQELETIFPSLIEETQDRGENDELLETTTKSVKYSVFVPMLIKAVQELKAEFDAYKATHP
jgi:hypothetical protein